MTAWEAKLMHVFITTFLSLLANVGLVVLAAEGQFKPELPLIFFAGTLGAVVNNYRRLLLIPRLPDESNELLRSNLVTLQFYLSPLIGGVFAMILYLLFLTGILQGSLFPSFQSTDKKFTDLTEFIKQTGFASNLDAAKAIFWSFIAGFSEKFVPNILDKIVEKWKMPAR